MKDLEHKEQCAIVNHIIARKRPGVFWFAVPNGGNRTAATGARLKREGVRAGVPDLHFLIGNGVVPLPLYLEYKTSEGVVSKSQLEIKREIEAAGGIWHCAYGIDQALEILVDFGVIWPERRG
ncbi:MAG: hypothetical protein GY938_22995 [Ketobacter sp.]|nr:hypothetical protein [Ketobacter sp.]